MCWISDRDATQEDADAFGNVIALPVMVDFITDGQHGYSVTCVNVFTFAPWESIKKGDPFIPWSEPFKELGGGLNEHPIPMNLTTSSKDL